MLPSRTNLTLFTYFEIVIMIFLSLPLLQADLTLFFSLAPTPFIGYNLEAVCRRLDYWVVQVALELLFW